MLKIQAPTTCPSCNSILEWTSSYLLFCRNLGCGAQSSKKLEHFAKTLKIKGLGPVAIAKLGLCDLHDIYEISVDHIAECLDSVKLAEKLYEEIANSKNASLNRLLPALSIPLIGKSATEKLALECEDIYSISTESCIKAGLGPIATENLVSWLQDNFYEGQLKRLPFRWEFHYIYEVPTNGTVCISGKLKSFKTKAEATKELQLSGYEVKSTVTKDVTHLINESGVESAKTLKARNSGIIIIENLNDFLGEI